MPIKDLSDAVRIPRLGKIHLGIKHPEKGYPMKTDYFVFPKDHPDYDKLVTVFGEKPKELRILIPNVVEEQWCSQYYKAYSLTHGLVCKGDGELAMRMIDTKTDTMVDKNATTVNMLEIPCLGKDCPEYKAKKCKETMNLRFILPEVPGIGVWQIDTGSINSIININSCAYHIKQTLGRLALIPLKLTLESIQVNNPETGKKQTVYVLNLRTDVTLTQLATSAREQTKMLQVGSLEDAFDMQVEDDINEFWPDGGTSPDKIKATAATKPEPVIEGQIISSDKDFDAMESASSKQETATAPQPVPVKKAAQKAKARPVKADRDASAIKTVNDLYKACNEDWDMQPRDVLQSLKLDSQSQITDLPGECYVKIKAGKE